jgi:hypothetical protein
MREEAKNYRKIFKQILCIPYLRYRSFSNRVLIKLFTSVNFPSANSLLG